MSRQGGGRRGRGGGRGGRRRTAAQMPVWQADPQLYSATPDSDHEFGVGSSKVSMQLDDTTSASLAPVPDQDASKGKQCKVAVAQALHLICHAKRRKVDTGTSSASASGSAEEHYKRQKSDSQEVDDNKTVTEKGAPAFKSTGVPTLDLFFNGMVRGASEAQIIQLMDAAWKQNAEQTMQVLLHARDCRGGKGEKEVVLRALLWLRMHKPRTYLRNVRRFLDVGCYRDLLQMAVRATKLRLHPLGRNELIELEILAEDLWFDHHQFEEWSAQVIRELGDKEEKAHHSSSAMVEPMRYDDEVLEEDSKTTPQQEAKEKPKKRIRLSLVAKWVPTENTKFDREAGLAKRLAGLLFSGNDKPYPLYRKLVTPLRTHIRVVEQLTCGGRWEEIEFGNVPSRAHHLLKKAFAKHTPDKYKKYLQNLKVGKEKINVQGLQPHELVSQYMGNRVTDVDDTIEEQWKATVARLRASGVHLQRALSLVDVSGSMEGVPMQVAIALGLLTSELCTSSFHNMVLTFETNPSMFIVTGNTLRERVKHLKKAPWGGSTDILAAFRVILQTAQQFNVPAEEMPTTLFIYSDMQFDSADSSMRGEAGHTALQSAHEQYARAGYHLPQVVFWNLRATVSVPSQNDAGVAMVSGFSPDLLKVFMENGDFSPQAVMNRAISKYQVEVDESEK